MSELALPEVVLGLRDVHKSFPGSPPTEVLFGVSLDVLGGELVALVGPSGSGKSTLLNIVGTLDRPTSGAVRIAGYDSAELSDRQLSAVRARELGFVFQQFFLLDGMTALDNVADGLLYTGTGRAERREQAAEALERVGLGHRVSHHPNQMSGGERQRVAIARAVVGHPALVLADEPTGNLDTRSSRSIIDLLHELNDEGATILVITHDREIATSFPRQIELRDGRVESDTGSALTPAGREP